MLLPIAPFTETSGTYVNCEGRAQSFAAVAKPQGAVRPGWKVLRVLGNLLALDGFAQDDSEAVRNEVLDAMEASALHNGIEGIMVASSMPAARGIERVADVPIYSGDMLVRRAPSLQKTRDAAAPAARMSSATLARLGISAGSKVRVARGAGQVEVLALADEGVAEGCVRIAAAHASTAALGAMSGELSVERI